METAILSLGITLDGAKHELVVRVRGATPLRWRAHVPVCGKFCIKLHPHLLRTAGHAYHPADRIVRAATGPPRRSVREVVPHCPAASHAASLIESHIAWRVDI